MQETIETWVRSLGWEDPLEEQMATCSNILAWRIPMDSPVGYCPWVNQQMGSLSVVPPGTHGTNAHNTWQFLIKRSYYSHRRWHWYH